MADVLARIVERKRAEVAARLAGRPVEAEPTRRSLRAALARPGARFIMEVKRASPSGHRSSVSVERAVTAYAPVADTISVLTDGPDFGGSFDDLRTARAGFDGPILAKDFIVDLAQVAEARAAGADAILVMMSVLGQAEARAVLDEARRLAMDAIVEVHDEGELARALDLGATIIGINNRDLKSLTTDLAATEQLARLVPANVLLISESGIAARTDVERLAPFADAFLVGSSLMAAPDIDEAARALTYGRVKLCGLTRAEDVRVAAAAGATHAGLILVPGTPRAVTVEQARPLADKVRALGLKAVGVSRDAGVTEILRAADYLGLAAIQLHGRETEAEVTQLRASLSAEVEIWVACPVDQVAIPRRLGADRTLFDTGRSGASGGSGTPFDWSLVQDRPDLSDAFLAGGIGPDNAAAAARVGAFGLDVGSGVEESPGRKDPVKVERLFAALRPSVRGDRA